MKRLQNAFRVLLVLTVGSLWSSGLIVAPTLFHVLPDRPLAGQLAGRIFSIETYLAVAAAVLGLLLPGRAKLMALYAAAALLALNEWGLRPFMAQARLSGASLGLSFGAWHGVSALLYGIACAATLWLVWKNDFR
ncbi:MAG: DUF4149 domain-containing protein [Steroidobacteraceae bacterium]